MPDELEIFISWSGERSHGVATALHQCLPLMFQTKVKPWLSSRDIDAGGRGQREISNHLQNCKVGIVCLTEDNLQSNWIHFEAGAISKVVEESYVCTYVIGINEVDVRPPLSQFQGSKADYEGTKRIVETINKALGDRALSPDILSETYHIMWGTLEAKLSAALTRLPVRARSDTRSEREILEEVLTLVRHYRKEVPDQLITLISDVHQLNGMIQGLRLPRSVPRPVSATSQVEVYQINPIETNESAPATPEEWKASLIEYFEHEEMDFSVDAMERAEVVGLGENRLKIVVPADFTIALQARELVPAVEALATRQMELLIHLGSRKVAK
jgi:hypothetical protein